MARKHSAVATNERDGAAASQGERSEKFLEVLQFHDANDQTEELAVWTDDLVGDVKDPGAGGAASHRRADGRRQAEGGLKRLEVVLIRNVVVRNRPVAREVDDLAAGIDQHQGVDRPQIDDPLLQHQMNVKAGHLVFKIFARFDLERLHVLDKSELGERQRFEGALEMFGQHRGYVLQLTSIFGENIVAKI